MMTCTSPILKPKLHLSETRNRSECRCVSRGLRQALMRYHEERAERRNPHQRRLSRRERKKKKPCRADCMQICLATCRFCHLITKLNGRIARHITLQVWRTCLSDSQVTSSSVYCEPFAIMRETEASRPMVQARPVRHLPNWNIPFPKGLCLGGPLAFQF